MTEKKTSMLKRAACLIITSTEDRRRNKFSSVQLSSDISEGYRFAFAEDAISAAISGLFDSSAHEAKLAQLAE